jgi:hypothetical protein
MTDIVESLLPCPFCGSGAHMECDKRMVVCDAWGCVATTVYATTALAIKAWNKRAPVAVAQAAWQPIETRPEFDHQPGRQFILLEGLDAGGVSAFSVLTVIGSVRRR